MFVIVDTSDRRGAVAIAASWAEAGRIGGAMFAAGLAPVIVEIGETREQWSWDQERGYWEPMPKDSAGQPTAAAEAVK